MSDTVKAASIIGGCLMLGLWGAGWLSKSEVGGYRLFEAIDEEPAISAVESLKNMTKYSQETPSVSLPEISPEKEDAIPNPFDEVKKKMRKRLLGD